MVRANPVILELEQGRLPRLRRLPRLEPLLVALHRARQDQAGPSMTMGIR